MSQAYPLAWPTGKPRTDWRKRQRGTFTSGGKPIGIAAAYERVQDELDRLGGKYGLVSSNLELTLSGRPRADRRAPDDPGVCLYFTLDGNPHAMACDAYSSVQQNLAAIAGHIEATRRIARYGVATAAESLRAFVALPQAKTCWEVLGLPSGASTAEIDAAFRRLARDAHPDQGGSAAAMAALNAARDQARLEASQ